MASQKKVWFITGISRGLGRAIAQEALSRGNVVVGTTRNGKSDISTDTENLHVLPLEVSIEKDVKATLAKAHAISNRLDVIVNNAGYGQMGAVEEVSATELEEQLRVNVFGTFYVVQAALPYLRAQKSGHIINMSSIGGLTTRPGLGAYAASKFAVEGLSQALVQEVIPLGIKVTIVEPGTFRTDFLADTSLRYAKTQIDAYATSSGEIVKRFEQLNGKQLGDPVLGAKAIMDIADSPNPPLHLLLGSDALSRAREMIANLKEEIDKWEKVSRSTDFVEVKAK